MPASRSRTERWRECLDQIYERNGGLELSVDRDEAEAHPADLVWRVRILKLTDDEIAVEQPTAVGHPIALAQGTRLIAGMSIGQNRWMFKTEVLSPGSGDALSLRQPGAVRLRMPDHVERCARRAFYRMTTAELRLPDIQCWPLLDPTSVVGAEVANRAQISALLRGEVAPDAIPDDADPIVLPEVGPPFRARLVNLGGGGAGLLVDRTASHGFDRSRMIWMRINLTPEIPAPVAVTAKLVHSHIDSGMNTYLGVAFDFSYHAAHKDFVISQITRYVQAQQRRQTLRRAA